MPTTTLDPVKLKETDATLVELAQKSGGDLRQLLYGVFSFLHRRTDFYCVAHEKDVESGKHRLGFKEGDAEKLLIAAFRQFPLRKLPQQNHSNSDPPGKSFSFKSDIDDAKASDKCPYEKDTITVPNTKSISCKKEKKEKSVESSIKQTPIRKAPQEDPMEGTRFTDEGLQVPIGNGGSTSSYRWTQTIDEVSVLVGSLPDGIRGKELAVSFKSNTISVKLKVKPSSQEKAGGTQPILLEGCLSNRIKTDESTWSLEGGVLLLLLQKARKMWWSNVLDGDDKIDISLVDSRRRLDEYDDSTQGMIRRIIFDQKQERLGKPNSDVILRREGGSSRGSASKFSTNLIPPLPPGVEYIDKSKLEKNDKYRSEM